MSERGEIKRDNAKAQKNSGRGQYQKGDAKWYNFVVDYKESKSPMGVCDCDVGCNRGVSAYGKERDANDRDVEAVHG